MIYHVRRAVGIGICLLPLFLAAATGRSCKPSSPLTPIPMLRIAPARRRYTPLHYARGLTEPHSAEIVVLLKKAGATE